MLQPIHSNVWLLLQQQTVQCEGFGLKVVQKKARNTAIGICSASVSMGKITAMRTRKSEEKEACLVFAKSVMWPELVSQT